MSVVLDQSQDVAGQEQHRLLTLYGMPEYVKQASHEALCGDPDTQPPHLYGDPANRTFPCHTKAATWMSTAFLEEKRASLTPRRARMIEKRLEKAAKYFSIAGELRQLKEKIAADSTAATSQLDDSDFAIVTPRGDRHYPLRNAGEVKAAAEWLSQYRDEFEYIDRQKIAAKILEKAAEHKTDTGEHHEMLEKTAGHGFCAAADIHKMLTERATLARWLFPKHAASLTKLAETVRKNPGKAREYQTLVKLASAVDQFDRDTQLNRRYHTGLPRAEEVLFQLNTKLAQDVINNHVSLASGNIYEKQALDNLPLEEVREWMGDDFAHEVSAGGLFVDSEKMANVAATLPRPDVERFERMLSGAGIRPYALEAARA